MKKVVSGIVLVLILLTITLPNINVISVQFESDTITVPDDYPTIQEAINAANPGDTIFVRSGIYYENIVVNKSLTIMGEDPYLTLIYGSESPLETWPLPIPIEVTVVNVTAEDVTFSGFTVKWGEVGIAVHNSLNVSLHNNVIVENLYGVNVVFSCHQKIYSNVFSCNTLIGVSISNSTKIMVANNTFVGNGNGVSIFFSDEVTIYKNVFFDNTATGIMASYMTHSMLEKTS